MKSFSFFNFFNPPGKAGKDRLLPYGRTLLWAMIIGLGGGGIATVYYWLLKGGLYLVWNIIQPALKSILAFTNGDIISF